MFIKQKLEENRDYLIKAYNEGTTISRLAAELECNTGSVYLFLRDICKIKLRERTCITNYMDDILKLGMENKSAYYIAKTLNLPPTTVGRYMKQLGFDISKNKKQRKQPLIDIKDEIIELYNNGMGCHKLAKKYSCAESSIIRLLRKCGIESNKYLKQYSINEQFFDNIQTEDQAYVYGFFVGDGCNYQSNYSIQIQICDLEILKKIAQAMEFTGVIHTTIGSGNSSDIYGIFVRSKYMSDRLAQIGCGSRKTFHTYFPDSSILPESLHKHFIRGLLDSDGSLYLNSQRSGQLLFTLSGTYCLLQGVQESLNSLNIDSRIYHHGNIFILRVVRQQDIKALLHWLYDDATIYLQRKKDKCLNIL